MQDFGLQIRYMVAEEFALTIGMLAALTFVPPNGIIDSIGKPVDYCRNGPRRHVRLLPGQLYWSV